MTSQRKVQSIHPIPVGLNRPTIITRDVNTELMGDAANPFINVSLFEMTGPTFPPHPHAGFTVATYLLPESESAFLNQDSTGFQNRIAQGGLHATVAGTGVLHEETNETEGAVALGFQIWINMTGENRKQAPHPVELKAEHVPVVQSKDATIRVLAGASNGVSSPLSLPTKVRMIDVALKPSAIFQQNLDEGERAFLFMVAGNIEIEGKTIGALTAISLVDSGTDLTVVAGHHGARFMLFSGELIHEPLVLGGPFVGSSEAEIQSYFASYRAGKMGTLTPFNQRKAA